MEKALGKAGVMYMGQQGSEGLDDGVEGSGTTKYTRKKRTKRYTPIPVIG